MRATADYLPSPGQIAFQCARIRAQWTPAERRRRAVGNPAEPQPLAWHPPVIDMSQCHARVRRIASEQSA